jgi:hypothetical protein
MFTVLSINAGVSVGAAEEAPIEAAVGFAAPSQNQTPDRGVLPLFTTHYTSSFITAKLTAVFFGGGAFTITLTST